MDPEGFLTVGGYQGLVDPWPETLKYAFENFSLPEVNTMLGPNLAAISGNMRSWDVIERLQTLRCGTPGGVHQAPGRFPECALMPAL